jgi:hypothetical protein
MTSDPCKLVMPQLALLVGDDLAGDDPAVTPSVAQLREHVAQCRACGDELARLAAARTALSELSWRSVAPTVDLWPALRVRLADQLNLPRERERAARRHWLRLRLAAAAAVLALTGVVWWSQRAPGPRDPVGALALSETAPGDVSREGTGASLPAEDLVVPAGALRRLAPSEQRFGAHAVEFSDPQSQPLLPGGWPLRPRGNALAGDGLR